MKDSITKYLHACLLCLIIACDQGTKYISQLYLEYSSVSANKFLSFCYSQNTGAAWGMFAGNAKILACLGLIAYAAIAYQKKHFTHWIQKIAITLILSGIAGNTIDRIFRGYVIDFITLNLKFYVWPSFNVADSALCIGSLILLFTFREKG